MVVRSVLCVPSAQSLFESLKSFWTELIVLSSIPMVVLVMKLDYEMNYKY
jgi:hypothetical protein